MGQRPRAREAGSGWWAGGGLGRKASWAGRLPGRGVGCVDAAACAATGWAAATVVAGCWAKKDRVGLGIRDLGLGFEKASNQNRIQT
jgi:hypothetical protein